MIVSFDTIIQQMPQSILLINFNKFGDSLLQTQIISGLHKHNPNLKIIVMASAQAFEVLINNPHIHHLELVPYIPESSYLNFFRYLMRCLSLVKRFGIKTILLDKTNSTPVTALLLNMISGTKKIYVGPLRRKIYKILVRGFTHIGDNLTEDDPIVNYNKLILEHFGIHEPANVEVFPLEKELDEEKKVVAGFRGQSKNPVICLAPFSSQNATSWPRERILEFIDIAAAENLVLVVGPETDFKKHQISFKNNSNVKLYSPGNIRRAFAVSQSCDILVSLDSAPAHFLEALKIPVFKINSARIPEKTWGYTNNRYFQIRKVVHCSPCYSSTCRTSGHPCMSSISGNEVYVTIKALLNSPTKG